MIQAIFAVRRSLLCLLVIACSFFSGQRAMCGTIYDFTATSLFPATDSNFSLLYHDLDADQKFSLNELISFSGVTSHFFGEFYDTISEVPINSSASPLTDGTSENWVFTNPASIFGSSPGVWSYTQSAVPLPAGVLLLGSGLIPLAYWTRHRKSLR